MLDETKILTLHPQGKKGVNISREKYNTTRTFLLETVAAHGDISFDELNELAEEQLNATFDGSIPWYVVTVKLDLEARQELERIPKTSPHRLRLGQKATT
ncbi:MAG: hypothetical protein AAGJ82_13145 [Bacteroidota bacterium]